MAYLSTASYKGTRDFYPEDMRFRKFMFSSLRQTVETFGYLEYDGPVVESFDLYAAKTGEEIVNTQLYHFMDRGERKVAIRPEMTPTMARMVAKKFHELPKPVRFYSIPNLWRYERPQKGRLREHWQLNVDVLGGEKLAGDFEILNVAFELIQNFKGEANIKILVNHRGLIDFLFHEHLKLPIEVAQKVVKALDARAKIGEEAYRLKVTEAGVQDKDFESLERFFKSDFSAVAKEFDCEGARHLSQLFEFAKGTPLEKALTFDPTVMRGMDYYTGTVFEIYDVSPENRRAMFGGGRYDQLLNLFGNYPLSGVGFGMGDVTLEDFLRHHKLVPNFESMIDVFVTLPKSEYQKTQLHVASLLRRAGLKTATALEVGSFSSQISLAVKHQAAYAILFGDSEFEKGEVLVKHLSTQKQFTCKMSDVVATIQKGT